MPVPALSRNRIIIYYLKGGIKWDALKKRLSYIRAD